MKCYIIKITSAWPMICNILSAGPRLRITALKKTSCGFQLLNHVNERAKLNEELSLPCVEERSVTFFTS